MKTFWQEYFTMSKRDRRATFCLFALLLLALFALYLKPHLLVSPPTDFTAFENQIHAFFSVSGPEKTSKTYGKEKGPDALEYFPFDPNHLPAEQWKRLGLTSRQIKMIRNYEKAGGQFRYVEDLRKIYAIDSATYARLKDHVRLPRYAAEKFRRNKRKEKLRRPQRKKKKKSYPVWKSHKTLPIIEINLADSTEWVQLKGIGPVFARRIIRYRNRLGGFVDARQLQEVYGLKDSTYYQIEEQLVLTEKGKTQMDQLDINSADFFTLVKHPYIDKNLANSIVMIRSTHGPYTTLLDLMRSDLVNEQIYRKIAPYLKVQHGD